MRRARKKVTQNHLLTTTDGGDCTTRVSSSLEDERKAPTSPVQRIRHNIDEGHRRESSQTVQDQEGEDQKQIWIYERAQAEKHICQRIKQ